MQIKLLLLLVSLLAVSQSSWGYGQNGHRITACIASQLLNDETHSAINEIFPRMTLMQMATYPDEMRSNPSDFWQEQANHYHYVTLHNGPQYQSSDAPAEGDAFTALRQYRDVLLDEGAAQSEKQLALSFIIHLIGDLHQPLHVGSYERNDRGGNAVKVSFFGDSSNLHSVWDTGIIEHQQLSFSEYCARLSNSLTKGKITQWQEASVKEWIAESAHWRETVYPEHVDSLSYDYIYHHNALSEKRLSQAGVRMAAYLNALFTTTKKG